MVRQTSPGQFDLDTTITDTYFSLRWLMVALAVSFPFILVIGRLVFDQSRTSDWLLGSLSEYYSSHPMRDWFVGILFAVAACLYLYKGLSDREDYLLNGAGGFAVLIAVNPWNWQPAGLPNEVKPHDVFAIAFFVLIALACWLCHDDSLKLNLVHEKERTRLKMKYGTIGVLLLLLPALAVLLNFTLTGSLKKSVLFVEAAAIWVFAYYWFTKSGELRDAIRREVRARPAHALKSA